jgi:hypothetical protein
MRHQVGRRTIASVRKERSRWHLCAPCMRVDKTRNEDPLHVVRLSIAQCWFGAAAADTMRLTKESELHKQVSRYSVATSYKSPPAGVCWPLYVLWCLCVVHNPAACSSVSVTCPIGTFALIWHCPTSKRGQAAAAAAAATVPVHTLAHKYIKGAISAYTHTRTTKHNSVNLVLLILTLSAIVSHCKTSAPSPLLPQPDDAARSARCATAAAAAAIMLHVVL